MVTGWGHWNMSSDEHLPALKQLGVKLFTQADCKERMETHSGKFQNDVAFCAGKSGRLLTLPEIRPLRIDNSGWSVNSSALFDVTGMRWYQRKYHVLYTIR